MLNYLLTLALAAAPISECRGAILFGLGAGLPAAHVFLVSVLGNIIVIPIIFWLIKMGGFRKLIFRLFGERINRLIEKNKPKFEKWGLIALVPFVAVPLPLTGAYSGILISEVLDFDRRKATLAMVIGVIIAATIVFLGASGVISILKI